MTSLAQQPVIASIPGLTAQLAAKQAADAQLADLAALAYAGNTLKVVRVNAGETALELATPSGGGGSAWGGITGTLSAQTDLQSALDAKASLASPALTGAPTIAGGTVTTDVKALDVSQTWNNAAVAFTAKKTNVSNTASAAGSLLCDYLVGGVSQFSIGKAGKVSIRTAGYGLFTIEQHDTYGLCLRAPGGAFCFATQEDGGLAALSLWAGSTGRLGFKSTAFSTNGVTVNQSIGFERVSDTELKVTQSGGALGDWKARRGSLSEYLDVVEMTEPAAPAANTARLFVVDVAGKSSLRVIFPSGVAQQLAIEL